MNRFRTSLAPRSPSSRRILLVGLTALTAALILAGAAGAQVSTNYDLSQYTLGAVGGWSASPRAAIESDLGQPFLGASESEQFAVESGHTHEPVPIPYEVPYEVYLPLLFKSP